MNLVKMKNFKTLINKGTVNIILNGWKAHEIPKYLRQKTNIRLQVGYNMEIPIPDLEFDKLGVRGTLIFKGKLEFVDIPWEAVYILVDNDRKGYYYENDVERYSNKVPTLAYTGNSKVTSKPKGNLRLVK